MNTARLSTKGQLVIPNEIRRIERHEQPTARLICEKGRKVLVAPAGAGPMTPETVKTLLNDFP